MLEISSPNNDRGNIKMCSQRNRMKVIFTQVNSSEEIKIGRIQFRKKEPQNYLGKGNKITLTVAEALNMCPKICSLAVRPKSREKPQAKTHKNLPSAFSHGSGFMHYFSFFLKKKTRKIITFVFSFHLSNF